MLREFFRKLADRLPIIRELRQINRSVDALRKELKGLRREMQALVEGSQSRTELVLASDSRFQDPARLLKYAFSVNSQNGEDGILREIFRRIGTTSRTFVELGVGDGTENNTAYLLATGWSGWWIDGCAGFLESVSAKSELAHRLQTRIATLTRENVEATLRDLAVPAECDLLSLDVDQNTFHLWQALGGFRPRVVVVEYNAAMPADVEWCVAYDPNRTWDGSINFGASLKALELLGRTRHYSLVGCDPTGVNAFFVRDDLVTDQFKAPFTSENHWEAARYGQTRRSGYRRTLLDPVARSLPNGADRG